MDDFLFDKLPSTSQSTPKPRLEPPQVDPGERLGTDSSISETSSLMSMDETQDQQIRSRMNDLGRKAEDLVGKINDSRMMDQKMMDNFQDKMVQKVCEICQQMKDHMYSTYEGNNHAMGATMAELSEVLESCTKLSTELRGANKALSGLNKGLIQPQEQ